VPAAVRPQIAALLQSYATTERRGVRLHRRAGATPADRQP